MTVYFNTFEFSSIPGFELAARHLQFAIANLLFAILRMDFSCLIRTLTVASKILYMYQAFYDFRTCPSSKSAWLSGSACLNKVFYPSEKH